MNREELLGSYVKVIALFAVLFLLYSELFVGTQSHASYITFLVEFSSQILHAIGFEHSTHIDRQLAYAHIKTDVGGDIVNGGFVLVDKNSDAIRESLLLIAAILAWQLSLRRKVIALVVGALLMIALNNVRIASLVVVDHYWPLYFPLASQWLLPALMVIFVLAYMMIVVRWNNDKLAE